MPGPEVLDVAYVAFDPGNNTGWATFDVAGNLVESDAFDAAEGFVAVYEFLKQLAPYTVARGGRLEVICESYELYPWKSKEQSWSSLETPKLIGAIEFWCYLTGTPLHMQRPQIKPIAYKWAGMKVPKNKTMTHSTDAYVHGVYYLQKEGIRKPQQARMGV